MPQQALSFLDYVFLVLLYLFFLRVLRAVWVELKEPRLVSGAAAAAAPPSRHDRAPQQPPTSGKRSMKLVVVPPRGGQRGPIWPLSEESTIGRAPGCAICLSSDNFVSQFHARVFCREDEYWVEDLGSTNGTLVNGRRVTGAVPLRQGDRVQVGRTVMELRK